MEIGQYFSIRFLEKDIGSFYKKGYFYKKIA